MIGRTIGRFRIVEKLGQGGMASVWKAEDALLGRFVALKVLEGLPGESEKARAMFRREAKAQAQLDHPAIAAVHDTGEEDGVAYIAMTYVDGETLSDRAARSLMPIDEVVRIGKTVAGALAHAHERRIIHRDVTGRNVLLARDGRAIVVDFGLALIEGATRLSSSKSVRGTAQYMAPEVIRGKTATAASDVYGLGVVLYEALTGRFPFDAERAEAFFYAKTAELPMVPLREVRPEVSPELDGTITRAMAWVPSDRHPNAGALFADLHRVAEASSPDSGSAGTTRRPPPAGATAPANHLPPSANGAPVFLAIMPLEVLGAAAGAEAVETSRGLTETLRARAARLSGIHVVPWTDPASGAPAEEPASACAERLGANLILRGTLRQSAHRIRITFGLIDPRQGTEITGDVIDGSSLELFDVEDQLSAKVVRALGHSEPDLVDERGGRKLPAADERFHQAQRHLQRTDNEASIDGSLGLLKDLVAAEPTNAGYQATLAKACLAKYELTGHRKWYESAAAACARALESAPGESSVLIAAGDLHAHSGRQEQAMAEYSRALEADPAAVEALLGRARVAHALGRQNEADQDCREAVRRDPTDWRGHSVLGFLEFSRGRYESAIRAWSEVTRLTPDNARGYENLGAAYFLSERHSESVASYRKSLDTMPTSRCYQNLGTVLFFLARYDECIEVLEKAVALAPRDPVAWGNLGNAARQVEGHEARAHEALETAIELMRERLRRNDRDAPAWARMAGWLVNLKRVDDAIAAIGKAFEIDSGNQYCMVRAGFVYFKAGDWDSAIHWFARAVRNGYGVGELQRDPELKPLREDPRFRRVLEKGAAGRHP